MAIVGKPLDATLIHHTGTFVRFHKTDKRFLPEGERACDIELPDGRLVRGKFAGNRDLFNVNGPELVRWIKSWLPRRASAEVVVHPVGTANRIRLELPFGGEYLTPGARRRLLSHAPEPKGLSGQRKRQAFSRWERDPKLRRFVLEVWGTKCQAEGCTSQAAISTSGVSDKLVDVHHLQSVSLGGDDSPANLVVLCLMHHGLMHRAAEVKATASIGEVRVMADGAAFDIKRDLAGLMAAMSWHP